MPSLEVVGDFDEVSEGITALAEVEGKSGVIFLDNGEGWESFLRRGGGEKVRSEGVGEEVTERGAPKRGGRVGFALGSEPVGEGFIGFINSRGSRT